jgi:hypothetical protein
LLSDGLATDMGANTISYGVSTDIEGITRPQSTIYDIGAYEYSSGGGQYYSVGGALSGLSGTLILQNNQGDNLSLSSNGTFNFNTSLLNNSTYNVTVLIQPSGQTCTVNNGSGTISGASVTNVSVTCATTSLPTSQIRMLLNGIRAHGVRIH